MSLGERHRMRRCMVVLCLAAALVLSIGTASAAPRASGADSHLKAAQSAKKCKGKKHGKRGKHRKCRKKVAPANVAPPGPKVTLTVGSTLPGAGTIDSSPNALSCGTVCSAQFDPGTVVTLSATQASGYFQSDWYGGGCSGRGSCVGTLNSHTPVVAGVIHRGAVRAAPRDNRPLPGRAPP